MKSLLVSATLLSLSAAASAADLPPRYAEPAPYGIVPIFTWTGFYAGLHAGYAFGEVDAASRDGTGRALGFTARSALPDRLSVDRDGFMIGGQAGYNLQQGMFVYGVEIDISAADANGSARRDFIDPAAGARFSNRTEARSTLDFLGTVRGRVGVAVDRALFYATGGLAYGGVNLKGSVASTTVPPSFARYEGRVEDTQIGFTVGAGAEYAITNNLTARAEYLYHNLGDETVTIRQGGAPQNAVSAKFENDGHATRLGLNYKF